MTSSWTGRRSHSGFSTPSMGSRRNSEELRNSSKRPFSQHQPSYSGAAPMGIRRGKKPRTELQSVEKNISPKFPATSHEFQLHSAPLKSKKIRTIRSSTCSSRSDAFWELHQSVQLDGVGFVERMREYEISRSTKHDRVRTLAKDRNSYSKAKDAKKRVIKRGSVIPARRQPLQPLKLSESSDEDEIIFIGETEQESVHSSSPIPSTNSLPTPQYPHLNNHQPSMSASRSAKAVAALTLALATGAGSLNDYHTARDDSSLDISHTGELWH